MLVLDTETTGLDRRCVLKELAGVWMETLDPASWRTFSMVVDVGACYWEPVALEMHLKSGLYYEKGDSLGYVLSSFRSWLGAVDKITVAGKNVAFDIDVLCRSQEAVAGHWGMSGRRLKFYDVEIGARTCDPAILWGLPLKSLSQIAALEGLTQSDHRALGDCLLVAELLRRKLS